MADIDTQIRQAYAALVQPNNCWVGVLEIRNALPHIDRTDLDRALIRIAVTDGNLVPESNQKTLTEEQREAAVWMGDQWKHLFCLDEI